MKRLDQNQEKWLSLSAFKQDPRNGGRSVLCEPGPTAQSCHRRSSRLFFGSNLLSEISKRLSGNDAPEMMGLLPGNLDALFGGRFRSARPRWSSETIENNIEVRTARRFKCGERSWTRSGPEGFAQAPWLQRRRGAGTDWWHTTALAKSNRNPGWPCCAPPIN
jgi:hypothetical protein